MFSHSGGVAKAALMNNIECVMYTTHSLPLKSLLKEKMDRGELPRGEIHKFAYNIRSQEVKDKADYIIGLVTHDLYQFREGAIPNEKGLFPNAPRTQEDALHTHTKTLHEITLLARAAEASKLIFIFTYNPLQGPSAAIFTNRGFRVEVFEFACMAPLNPSPYLYCLVATSCPEMPAIHFLEVEEPLMVNCLIPTTNTEEVVTTPSTLIQRIVLWDIAPSMADQIFKHVLKPRDIPDAQVVFTRTLVKGESEHWRYDKLDPEDIFDLSRQPIKNPMKAAKLMGWPQDWTPGLLY